MVQEFSGVALWERWGSQQLVETSRQLAQCIGKAMGGGVLGSISDRLHGDVGTASNELGIMGLCLLRQRC